MSRTLVVTFGLVFAAGLSIVSFADESRTEVAVVRDAETPEAAFAGFRDGVVKGDWQAAFRFMTSESRDSLVGSLLAATWMGAAGDSGKELVRRSVTDVARLEELIAEAGRLQRTNRMPGAGPPPEFTQLLGKIAALVKDQPAFLKEAHAIWREQGRPSVTNDLDQAELTEVKIEGDAATAEIRIETPRGVGSEDIAFKKIGDHWFVDKRG